MSRTQPASITSMLNMPSPISKVQGGTDTMLTDLKCEDGLVDSTNHDSSDSDIISGYDVHTVTVDKTIGVKMELGLLLTVVKTIPPEIHKLLPHLTEMVSVYKVESLAMQQAGVCAGDLLLDRMVDAKHSSSSNEPAWSFLNLSSLQTIVAGSEGKSSLTIFVARKKAATVDDVKPNKTLIANHLKSSNPPTETAAVVPDALKATTSATSTTTDDDTKPPLRSEPKVQVKAENDLPKVDKALLAPNQSDSPSADSNLNSAPIAKPTTTVARPSILKAKISLKGTYKSDYQVYEVMVNKRWGHAFKLGLTITSTKTLKPEQQQAFPDCAEIAYVHTTVAESALIGVDIRPGDILVQPKATMAKELIQRPEHYDSLWTLMSLDQLQDDIVESKDAFSFRLYLARKLPAAGTAPMPDAAKLFVPPAISATAATYADQKDGSYQKRPVPADLSDDKRLCKKLKLLSASQLQNIRPKTEGTIADDKKPILPATAYGTRRISMSPAAAPKSVVSSVASCNAPTKAKPRTAAAQASSGPASGSMGNVADGLAAYKHIVDLVVPENKSLHDECADLVRRAQLIVTNAMNEVNSMQQYVASQRPVKLHANDSVLSSLYTTSLYPVLSPPVLATADAAFWTSLGKFADDIRKQSAALRSAKVALEAERQRRLAKMHALLKDYRTWKTEYKKAQTKLGKIRNDAMTAFGFGWT